jgi:signal peptidase II
MAFGMQFAGDYGKLFLSIFRIIAVILIAYFLYRVSRHKTSNGFIISLSLILAGAVGNILDSAFYGLLFSESTYFDAARFLPAAGGYSNFLHGRVVDMFYFPILEGNFPSWVPFWGGQDFIFFRPVFNVADSAITIGVMLLLFFQSSVSKK